MTDTPERWMRLALAEAEQAAALGEVPVGAVVVRGGAVIASAGNRRAALGDPTAHAELLALRAAAARLGDWRLEGCTLYVTLEPCPMCAGAAAMARLDSIWYGTADAAAGCCGSVYRLPEDPAFGKPIPCDGGLLAAECGALMARFFERRRQDAKGTDGVDNMDNGDADRPHHPHAGDAGPAALGLWAGGGPVPPPSAR